jgi:mRNA interferase MazF
MKSGTQLKFGDIILAEIPFVEINEVKKRPALVLFEEHNNVILMGITSNPLMKGIQITKKEGALTNSIIKLNYIFTIDKNKIIKKLFSLSKNKKDLISREFIKKIK